MSPLLAFGILAVSFVILTKCADWFIDGAVGMAEIFSLPRMVVGMFMVGFATTAPELAVSVQAAFMGHSEIALGNAIGSVIVDDGVAMAVAAIIAPTAILIPGRILKTAAIFLIVIDLVAYAMASNGVLNRIEGGILVAAFFAYLVYIIRSRSVMIEDEMELIDQIEAKTTDWKRPTLLFLGGLVGVLLSSRGVIESSLVIARFFNVSEAIIGLTVIAIGTSLPEISTCIVAARKGEGQIAVGDIIGADIMNVCWIAGASAVVRPIHVSLRMINFAFPFMLVIVITMLGMMRHRYKLERKHGFVLLSIYAVYIFLTIKLFFEH